MITDKIKAFRAAMDYIANPPQGMFELHYCNPAKLVGVFTTLDDAIAHQSRDYCQYIVKREPARCTVVWSTARDNPRMKVGYSWPTVHGTVREEE